jgi:hypothetical protein
VELAQQSIDHNKRVRCPISRSKQKLPGAKFHGPNMNHDGKNRSIRQGTDLKQHSTDNFDVGLHCEPIR